jgi:hypothetical protein
VLNVAARSLPWSSPKSMQAAAAAAGISAPLGDWFYSRGLAASISAGASRRLM